LKFWAELIHRWWGTNNRFFKDTEYRRGILRRAENAGIYVLRGTFVAAVAGVLQRGAREFFSVDNSISN
jgi:hypothetical protein